MPILQYFYCHQTPLHVTMSNSHDNKRTCPCKRLPLVLSSLTGAEYGDLHSLRRHNRDSIKTKKDSAGNTPLMIAAQNGHIQATAFLLEAGCDVNAPDSGATPLHRASFSGAVGTMRLLLERPDCDLMLPDTSFGDRMTALHKAAAGGRYLAVQLLLAVHAQRGTLAQALQARDANDQTPLQVALSKLPRQAEERQSVARWDMVAGGRVADWTLCVQILQRAAKDGTGLDVREMDDGTLPPNLLTQQSAQSNGDSDNCIDCEVGECATKSWEMAFQRGLMQAMERQLVAKPVENESTTLQTTTISNTSTDVSDTTTQQGGVANENTTNKDEKSDLGRPCDACVNRSLFLYPVSGRLVCRSCKKRSKFD
mmetsp:Transcript_16574/g.31505  ORF Transcript_16574/g.31505 Transcript_16574/m.31505 type:complete len:368 (-) Transcript_16574:760-1863(-)